MTEQGTPAKKSAAGPVARARRRAKRLIGPTLGVFGLDSEGHRLPPQGDTGEGTRGRIQEAEEKDDRARLAIAEAEIETERRERQYSAASRPTATKR